MNASYLLLDEPWIPVVDLTGEKKLLGIRALLEQAHLLREISDPSPLVEYGLYRLLVVFLMDALRPQDEDELEELLDARQFDMNAIERYITLCRNEGVTFDLFDRERPFLQAPFNEAWDKERQPVSDLDFTIPHGNNHVHFDHRKNQEIAFSYGEAARILTTIPIFCTQGGRGYSPGINGQPPYYTIIRGNTLFETLTFSLVLREDIHMSFDEPPVIWRSTIPIEPNQKIPNQMIPKMSWLYGMLFPVRRVLLIPNTANQTIKEIYFGPGLKYTAIDVWTDSHIAYLISDKGRFPWCPNREKAIWRNLYELTAPNQAPQIVQQYKKYIAPFDSSLIHLLLYGVQTDKANYIAAMRHNLKLSTAIIENPETSELIRNAIAGAEELAGILQKAMTHPDIPPQTVSQAVQNYYDNCGKALMTLCDTELMKEDVDLETLYQDWISQTSQYAVDALHEAMRTVMLRGKSLMKVTRRQGILFAEIKKKKEAKS